MTEKPAFKAANVEVPTISDWRAQFIAFYDAVDASQVRDNTGDDSAVSVTLWSWAELRAIAQEAGPIV